MSADFWAGYISGAAGILIGNPLDVIKVRLQATTTITTTATPPLAPASQTPARPWATLRALAAGTAAPVLGYGALNALLFVSYNRAEALLNGGGASSTTGSNLWTTWAAGAAGGLATWAVSTPTELVKCRAQLAQPSSSSSSSSSSWAVARHVWRREGGVRGFYLGGAVTALRDGVGYGFYFWSYELCSRWMRRWDGDGGGGRGGGGGGGEAARVLLCGGVAGVVTWASIFPLDTIKTRVQAQQVGALGAAVAAASEGSPLLPSASDAPDRSRRLGAVEVAREAYREGGVRVFFRGLTVCSVRAFVVNAAQWAVYEWIMREMGQGRELRASASAEAMEAAA
ncbi:hypothetical protein RB601_005698 [Gaeumannomyces tritici]